ncbi:MAG: hypothetical protein WC794_03890 [Candidatus Doudnabacteria bacterium]|jgi:antitoxin component of MazEF toxin-antitoxin module
MGTSGGVNRKIFKTGHSLAVTLSKNVLEEMGLSEGDSVNVQLSHGQAVVTKAGHKEQLSLGLKIRPHLK